MPACFPQIRNFEGRIVAKDNTAWCGASARTRDQEAWAADEIGLIPGGSGGSEEQGK